MGLLMFFFKLIVGAVLFTVALALLITAFELPPLLISLVIGPMNAELAQVYTLIEIGVILGILILGLPRGYAWFSQHWNQWTQKNLKSKP